MKGLLTNSDWLARECAREWVRTGVSNTGNRKSQVIVTDNFVDWKKRFILNNLLNVVEIIMTQRV